MSQKTDVVKEIKKWCKTEFASSSWAWITNLEGDMKTIHVAVIMKTKRTPEIDTTLTHIVSAIKRKFSTEDLDIAIYDKKVAPKRPRRT